MVVNLPPSIKSFVLCFMRNVNECRITLVKNLIKESFYGKRKKVINVLIAFFILFYYYISCILLNPMISTCFLFIIIIIKS